MCVGLCVWGASSVRVRNVEMGEKGEWDAEYGSSK